MVERFYGPLTGFEMRPGERGDYVRYSDYAALKAQLAEKDVELNNLRESMEELSLRLCDAEGALWRVFPNTHTIPSDHPLGKKTPDPFEGPGETYRAAYERMQSENEMLRKALEEIAAPAIFFLSRKDAIKMRDAARAALEPAAPEGRREAVAVGIFRNGKMVGWAGYPGEEFILPEDTDERRLLYTRPSEQAVTDAMIARASAEYQAIFGKYLLSSHARRILKAAMEVSDA